MTKLGVLESQKTKRKNPPRGYREGAKNTAKAGLTGLPDW
jgi:hypothetical protein